MAVSSPGFRYLCIWGILGALCGSCVLRGTQESQPPQSPMPEQTLATSPDYSSAVPRPQVSASRSVQPLYFEANQGQHDEAVKYVARGRGYALFVTPTETVLALRSPFLDKKQRVSNNPNERVFQLLSPNVAMWSPSYLRFSLVEGNPEPRLTAEELLPGTVNSYVSRDITRWRSMLPTYGKVRSHSVYPGIDMLYYGHHGQIEYDFIVHPGADPTQIRLQVVGAEDLKVDAWGDAVLYVPEGEVRLRRPYIYQEVNGKRQRINGRYRLLAAAVLGGGQKEKTSPGSGELRFSIDSYDATKPLVIDPVLSYVAYVGGSRTDEGMAVAVDAERNIYVTGQTDSFDFPAKNAVQSALAGSLDVFVAKFTASGQLLYSTYLGGDGKDFSTGLALDVTGSVYVAGATDSEGFPILHPYQPTKNGSTDAFVAKFSSLGTLVYSTYLGGADGATLAAGIAVDAHQQAHVTGTTSSTVFPITPTALQRERGESSQPQFATHDAFVTKFSATGSTVMYSTYLGGSGKDTGRSIAVDAIGEAYVVGTTNSLDFPTLNPVQPMLKDAQGDAFVAKLNATGSKLQYATYLGGSAAEEVSGAAIDATGHAYVAGTTYSTDFPATTNAARVGSRGSLVKAPAGEAFVAKINPTGTALLYATYLGGEGNEESGLFSSGALAVDAVGNAYVVGATNSADFPLQSPVQSTNRGFYDAFVTKLNSSGTLLYSTYLGGGSDDAALAIAVDDDGTAYIVGETLSRDFLATSDEALQHNERGASLSRGFSDAFFVQLIDDVPLIVSSPSLEFGTLSIGMTKDLSVTLRNEGKQAYSGTMSSSAVAFRLLSQEENFQLQPGASLTIPVRFAALSAGNFTGALQVTGSGQPVNILLSGTGANEHGPALSACHSQLDFGRALVNREKLITCTLTNEGSQPLSGSTTLVDGPISIVSGEEFFLAPKESRPLTLRLSPTPDDVGPTAGSVTLSTSAGVVGVALQGLVLAAESGVDASPTTLNFGGVQVGQSRQLRVTVRNLSASPLNRTVCVPAGFSVSPATLALGAGASAILNVSFTPSVPGPQTYGGAVRFSSTSCANPTVDPTEVIITGSGMPANARGVAYVANRDEGTVSVVDTGNQEEMQLVATGRTPVSVALTPNGQRAYVVNFGANSVSIVDTNSQVVIATLPVGLNPASVVISPDGQRVYVVHQGENTLSIIDAVNETVLRRTVDARRPFPQTLVMSPDGAFVYVLGVGSNLVSVLNTATVVVEPVPVGQDPVAMAFSPDGRQAYVANRGTKAFAVLDTTTFPPTKLGDVNSTTGDGTQSVEVSIEGKVYATYRNGQISVFQPASTLAILAVEGGREARAALNPSLFAESPIGTRTNPALIQTVQGKIGVVEGVPTTPAPGTFAVIAANDTLGTATTVGNQPEEGIANPDPQRPVQLVPNSGSGSMSFVTPGTPSAPQAPVGVTPVAVDVYVSPPPSTCVTAASGPSGTFGSGEGNGTVTVVAGNCRWGARSRESWIKLTGGLIPSLVFAVGSGGIDFTLEPNEGTTERKGIIQILDREIEVRQAARGVLRGDANGDGRSDLIWRHSSGVTSLWLLNGGSLVQSPIGLAVMPGSQWEVVSTGDFNGDGKSDLVWRHSSGVTYLWLMNGGTLLQPPIGLAVMPGSQWEVVSTGDFNGDGKSDLVWRHSSGVTYLWLMNGGTLLQPPIGLAVMPGSQWEVVSTGDFNGDGKSDLVWRHSSGITYLWLLNGDTLLQQPIGLAVMPSSQWEVLTTGDFNGDGKSDLVWRHSSGITYLWLLNGGTLAQSPIGLAVMPGGQWEVLGQN
jgi:YVTN family beta-propeller protein